MKKRFLRAADLFCGAGGTSTGFAMACEKAGVKLHLTAVNHWDVAVDTHSQNHPDAQHFCASLDSLNPREACPDGIDVLFASPECTHHSIARGGKPINDQSRATAWCVVRWAEVHLPAFIFVENVPEFVTWGGIGTNGRPMKSKKGATFMAWIAALESLGYRVDWSVLCAADYGAPTTRKRLFIQAVRGRKEIIWPEPSHAKVVGNDLFSDLKQWVPAREIIDWALPSQSIYDRKKPLSDKTLRRIYAGFEKFGLKNFGQANPFIVAWDHQSGSGVWDANSPLSTVTTKARHGVAEPFIIPHFGERPTQKPRTHSINEPLPTVTSHGAGSLVEPFLVELRGTNNDQIAKSAKSTDDPLTTVSTSGAHHALVESFLVSTCHSGGDRTKSLAEPLPTVCGNRGDYALCEPSLLPQQSGGALRSIEEPAPTIATAGAIGLVEPYLIPFYGTSKASSVDEPLATVTTKDRFGLVRPVVTLNGVKHEVDIRFRMLQPHELSAAQGFPRDYKFAGNKTEQVKQIGNAVPPDFAEAFGNVVINQFFKK